MSEHSRPSSVKITNPNIQRHLEDLSRTYRSRMRRHRASATSQRTREVTSAQLERHVTHLTSTSVSLNERHGFMTSLLDQEDSPRVEDVTSAQATEWPSEDDVRGTPSEPVVKGTPRVTRTPGLIMTDIVEQQGSDYRNPPTKPYIKFRRAARAVMLIQRVCRVCKDLVYDSVCSEEWYSRIEHFAGSGSVDQQSKRVRPFITLVPNQDRQLVQLTFDRSEYYKERRVDLTEEMRRNLSIEASSRSPEQNIEVLRFLKRASPAFNSYTLDTQKQMVHSMWFDTYQKDRVITAQGSQADGIFFVLSGKLVEKAKDRKQLREIKQGEEFGEEDIKCACPRRTTVVTQTTVDLITIHRQDYRAIFNMSVDSNDPKYLEICKQDLVFQHFPIHRLIDNPGVWTVLSYKFGCLMVKDSNEMEWIYIIKSGEARVIKHLTAADFNVRKRRREIEERQNLQSATYKNRQIIDFIESRHVQKSHYGRDVYIPRRPPTTPFTSAPPVLRQSTRDRRQAYTSTPDGRHDGGPGNGYKLYNCTNQSHTNHRQNNKELSFHRDDTRSIPSQNLSRKGSRARPHTCINAARKPACARASVVTRPKTGFQKPVVEIRIEDFDKELEAQQAWSEEVEETGGGHSTVTPRSDWSTVTSVTTADSSSERATRGQYVQTSGHNSPQDGGVSDLCLRLPAVSTTSNSPRSQLSSGRGGKGGVMVKVPPFVQLESLVPGKVFGLRSCLKPEERGPSASLVSGGCEVLQINKKFFLKHADDAILSLIKLKYKAFPSEDELVDRLDVNIRWEEYKQNTVLDFLRKRGKQASGYNTAFVSVT